MSIKKKKYSVYYLLQKGSAISEYIPVLGLVFAIAIVTYTQYGGVSRYQGSKIAQELSGQNSAGQSFVGGPYYGRTNLGNVAQFDAQGNMIPGTGGGSSNGTGSGSGNGTGTGSGAGNGTGSGTGGGAGTGTGSGSGAGNTGGSSGTGGGSGNGNGGGSSGTGNPSCGASTSASSFAQIPGTGVGNPIHVVSGNKYQEEVDIVSLPGELGLGFTRYYNSQINTNTVMGYGWRHSYSTYLEYKDNVIQVFQNDGRRIDFERVENIGAVKYSSQRISDGYIEKSDQGYHWYWQSGRLLRFNTHGRLQSIEANNGKTLTFHLLESGRLASVSDSKQRSIKFKYNKLGFINEVTSPLGEIVQFKYDNLGNLIQSIYADNTSRSYEYNDSNDAHNLTALKNRLDIHFATWKYDNYDRAIYSSHADGVNEVSISYAGNNRVITDSLGKESIYTVDYIKGIPVVTSIVGSACNSCNAGDVEYQYNDRIQLTSMRTEDNTTTLYTYDIANRQIGMKETDQEQKILAWKRYEYEGTSIKPSAIHRPSINNEKTFAVLYQYDDKDNLTKITERGYTPVLNAKNKVDMYQLVERDISLEYKGYDVVKIDGPREDVDDITRFEYNNEHQLTKVIQADGTQYSVLSYDSFDRPLEILQGNNLPMHISYNAHGEVIAISNGKQEVKYSYDAESQLKKITNPNGTIVNLSYDNAGRNSSLSDEIGNQIIHSWDTENKAIATQVKNKSGNVIWAMMKLYDAQGRLRATSSPEGLHSLYGYKDDTTKVNLAINGAQDVEYFEHKNDTSAKLLKNDDNQIQNIGNKTSGIWALKDELGRITLHMRDDFGNLVFIGNPDTGITLHKYDLANNLVQTANSESIVKKYFYNASNQLVKQEFNGDETVYQYNYGRLEKIIAQSSTEQYKYNQYGVITQHIRKIDGKLFTTDYSYDDKTGKLMQKKLLSGDVLSYQYDAQLARLSDIEHKHNKIAQPIISDIRYQPFGERESYQQNNGIMINFRYDKSGLIREIKEDNYNLYQYTYNDSHNITEINRNGAKEQYGYDSLGRLVKAKSAMGIFEYKYDALGNRMQTPGLQKVSSNSKTVFNKVGLLKNIANRSYQYNTEGRPIKLYVDGNLKAEYVYNAQGQRIKKTIKGSTSEVTYFLYDMQSRLAAEANSNGDIIKEYIYLGKTPIAVIENGTIYSIHSDHLGTPIQIRDKNKNIVWLANYAPFGRVEIENQTIDFNLRFTGQYHDTESNTYYNYFRDYDPQFGRYLQPDPLGVSQGTNLYAYVDNNPLKATDPFGLFKIRANVGPQTDPVHEYIVQRAFTLFNASNGNPFSQHTINLFIQANVRTDLVQGNQFSAMHFDNPSDASGTNAQANWIANTMSIIDGKRSLYAIVNGTALPVCPLPGSVAPVANPDISALVEAFGQNTHGLSDFYAHTNWVDNATRGGAYTQYKQTGRGKSQTFVDSGTVPSGIGEVNQIWDETTLKHNNQWIYSGNAEGCSTLACVGLAFKSSGGIPGTGAYYHNVIDGQDYQGNWDTTTHAYWAKDEAAVGTPFYQARQLAVTHVLQEIGKLYNAASNNPQLLQIYKSSQNQKQLSSVQYAAPSICMSCVSWTDDDNVISYVNQFYQSESNAGKLDK